VAARYRRRMASMRPRIDAVRPNQCAMRGLAAARAALEGEGDALPADEFAALQAQWDREQDAERTAQAVLALRPSA